MRAAKYKLALFEETPRPIDFWLITGVVANVKSGLAGGCIVLGRAVVAIVAHGARFPAAIDRGKQIPVIAIVSLVEQRFDLDRDARYGRKIESELPPGRSLSFMASIPRRINRAGTCHKNTDSGHRDEHAPRRSQENCVYNLARSR